MDPNQWRNFNSAYSSLSRLDTPILTTEQSGVSVGALSSHAHLAGTRQVPGLTGPSVSQLLDQSAFGRQHHYKPPGLSPFGVEGVHSRDTEHLGLGLSPSNSIFAQDCNLGIVEDKGRNWDIPNLTQTSPNLFGELPTDLSPQNNQRSVNLFGEILSDLSPTSQRTLPPPAHSGISNLQQNSVQHGLFQNSPGFSVQTTSHSPISPTFNLPPSERDYYLSPKIENLSAPISSETQYNYRGLSSQPYTDSVKRESQYDPISPAPSDTGQQTDHYNNFSSTQPYRNQEHFNFSSGSSLHHHSYRPNQNQELSTGNYRPNQIQEPNHSTGIYRPNQIQEPEHSTGIYNPSIASFPHCTSLPVEKSTTIQAVADSTTKPKKGRGRKKKEPSVLEDTKNFQEKTLVDSYIQQEQQLQILSQNRTQENSFRQNPSQMSGNVYGQTFRNNNPSSSAYNMQSPQISSTKTTAVHGQAGNNYSTKHATQLGNNYSCPPSGTNIMENLGQTNVNFTNSAVHSERFSGHDMHSTNQRNNFMSQGFISNEENIPMANREKIIDNNEFAYNEPSNQQSFVDQLNANSDFDALNSMELESGIYSSGGENMFNLDTFNPNSQQQNNNCGGNAIANNSTSTIDEAALSSLISESPQMDRRDDRLYEAYTCEQNKPFIAEPSIPPVAISNPIDEDDEFKHLKKPPETDKPQVKSQNQPKVQIPSFEKKTNLQPRVVIEPLPPQKPREKPPTKSSKNNAFMDSFLSFIQGKKPETLSSVNTSVVKKPELPKYIPEPKRPPRQTSVDKSSDSAASTPRPDTDTKPESPSNDDTASSRVSDEEMNTQVTGTVKNIETGSDQHPSLKMRIKLQTISPPKHKKTKSNKLSSKQRRSSGYQESEEEEIKSSGEEYQVGSSEEEEEKVRTPAPVAPARRLSTRKAKEKLLQKKYKESESDVDGDGMPETYDSDSDPAWTPFAVEKKEPAFDEFAGPQRRSRKGSTKTKLKPKRVGKSSRPSAAKSRKVEQTAPVAYPRAPSPQYESSEESEEEETQYDGFVMGSFVINKKDLNNFEGFPIWKIEAGKMMRKYELFIEKGEIFHRSLSTYSSWLPHMEKNYISVRTKQIPHMRTTVRDSQFVVQVQEEDRPKPKLDSSKETEYEKDPLADMFNVYLQVFLSQAMEPTFLGAIHESGEDFYLKPLNMIDAVISKKLLEINSKVRWKIDFKKTAEVRPHIREVDRPNLKTMCQATENATQTAIKSVHLFGQPYDGITLEEIPDKAAKQGSVEYLVGKLASNYIGAYHSLHHFKYNLYKRCLAKVDIVREGNTECDNAEILDKCLNNRTWVLKIFDDLKNMLEKG